MLEGGDVSLSEPRMWGVAARTQYSCRKMFLSNFLKTTGRFNDRKIDVQCPQLPPVAVPVQGGVAGY